LKWPGYKKMGTGAELNLKIPEDPQNYELMLIAKMKDCEYVISSKSVYIPHFGNSSAQIKFLLRMRLY